MTPPAQLYQWSHTGQTSRRTPRESQSDTTGESVGHHGRVRRPHLEQINELLLPLRLRVVRVREDESLEMLYLSASVLQLVCLRAERLQQHHALGPQLLVLLRQLVDVALQISQLL